MARSPCGESLHTARHRRWRGYRWWTPIIFLLGLLLGDGAHAADRSEPSSRVPRPVIEAARGGTCVEPPPVMRRKHPQYLMHQRDDTLRGGIRGAKYSLKACIECHASPATGSVAAAPTNFCISCHSYAAVKVDCFECHTPRSGQAVSTLQPLVHPAGLHAALHRQLRQLAPSPQP